MTADYQTGSYHVNVTIVCCPLLNCFCSDVYSNNSALKLGK